MKRIEENESVGFKQDMLMYNIKPPTFKFPPPFPLTPFLIPNRVQTLHKYAEVDIIPLPFAIAPRHLNNH